MEDEAYLDPAGTRCLMIVRLIALYGILDGPAIGDAIVREEKEGWMVDRRGRWKFQLKAVSVIYGVISLGG